MLQSTSPRKTTDEGSTPSVSKFGPWVLGLLLVGATFLAYLPVMHAGFIWDDDKYVTANRLLTAPDGLRLIWFSLDSPSQYFPLTYTWLRFEHDLWGLNPAGYHGMNLLLHTVNALLLWRLLKRLAVPGAWLGAAIFALHPVQVESVAWVSELKNVLMLFFYLLAVLAWVEFIEKPAGQGRRYYLLSLVLYVLALCAKTTACTLPVTLLLILWLKKKPIDRARLAQTLPFFVFGLGMGLLAIWWERYHQDTEGTVFAISWLQRVLIAGHAFWFYLGKLLWPANLTFIYPRWTIKAVGISAYLWPATAALLGGVIYFIRRFSGRSVETALIFFAVTLAPVLGFIMLYTFCYTFVADHYQYVACIGPIALASAGLSLAFGSLGRRAALAKIILSGALLLTLGVLTWRQCGLYANAETLWRVTLARNPSCWMAQNNLAAELIAQGNLDEAIKHCEQARQLNPDNAPTYNNLGQALLGKGKVDDAIAQFQKALQIYPGFASAHNNLGNALFQRGSLDEAMVQYREALQIDPGFALAHNNLGNALFQRGSLDEAMVQYREALQIDPGFALAHYNLGSALLEAGSPDEAMTQFQAAVQLNPQLALAHDNLGNLLMKMGRVDEALAQFQAALKINPNLPQVHNNLATILAQSGQMDEAIVHFEKAVQLDPNYAEAHNNLGSALLIKGRVVEAIAQYQKVLQLKPQNVETLNNLAWVLATCPRASLRNGQEAVELAQRANQLAGDGNPVVLSTLAAAYAEAGRFPEAVKTAEHALTVAETLPGSAPRLRARAGDAIRSQLKLYQAGKPFRDTERAP